MKWFITRWWSLSTGELQNLGNPDALRDCQPSPEAETHKTKGRVWRKGNKKTLTVGIHLFSMINFLFSSVQKISKKKWQFCARGSPFWKTSSWQSQRWYQSSLEIVPKKNSFLSQGVHNSKQEAAAREKEKELEREQKSRKESRRNSVLPKDLDTLDDSDFFSRSSTSGFGSDLSRRETLQLLGELWFHPLCRSRSTKGRNNRYYVRIVHL